MIPSNFLPCFLLQQAQGKTTMLTRYSSSYTFYLLSEGRRVHSHSHGNQVRQQVNKLSDWNMYMRPASSSFMCICECVSCVLSHLHDSVDLILKMFPKGTGCQVFQTPQCSLARICVKMFELPPSVDILQVCKIPQSFSLKNHILHPIIRKKYYYYIELLLWSSSTLLLLLL